MLADFFAGLGFAYLGMLYLPMGNQMPDQYGGDRTEDSPQAMMPARPASWRLFVRRH